MKLKDKIFIVIAIAAFLGGLFWYRTYSVNIQKQKEIDVINVQRAKEINSKIIEESAERDKNDEMQTRMDECISEAETKYNKSLDTIGKFLDEALNQKNPRPGTAEAIRLSMDDIKKTRSEDVDICLKRYSTR